MKKVILITGTSSGFGAMMVNRFSAAGHTVIATMRGTKSKNAVIAETLAKLPGVDVMELDVTQEESVAHAVQQILDRHQQIDVLINNAGVYGHGLLEGYSIAQFHKTMDINVYGILRMYHAVLPSMRERKDGLIINISSSAGSFALPLQAPYNVSKFAVEAITEGSYKELISQGIESVAIQPGGFFTELMTKEGINADRPEIEQSYGTFAADTMARTAAQFGVVLEKYKPDPLLVVDAALALINMPKGTRPLRTPLDPIAQGVEQEYDVKAAEIKRRWLDNYGL